MQAEKEEAKMERFNELLHGSAEQAAGVLESNGDIDAQELQAALTNALLKIADLQRQIERINISAKTSNF